MSGGVRTSGSVRVGVLALLWGSTFLWIELALRGMTPAQVTFARCVLGALALLAACRWTGQRLPRDGRVLRHVVVAAFFCNALPFALFSFGQKSVDSGVAGVLNATTPLWSLLIGFLAGTERARRPLRAAGLLLGFAGTLLIFAPWRHGGPTGLGALAVLGAAASYAVAFAYMGRRLAGRHGTLPLAAAQLVAASVLTALALPAGGPPPARPDLAVWIAVAVLGLLCTGVTFYLTYRVIADEGATDAATVGYLLPVVSVTLGALFLGEDVGLRIVAGMATVLAGVAMTRRRGKAPPQEPGPGSVPAPPGRTPGPHTRTEAAPGSTPRP